MLIKQVEVIEKVTTKNVKRFNFVVGTSKTEYTALEIKDSVVVAFEYNGKIDIVEYEKKDVQNFIDDGVWVVVYSE